MQTLFAGEGGHLRGICYSANINNNTHNTINCLNPWDVQSKHIVTPDGVSETLCAAEKRWTGMPPNVCYAIEGDYKDPQIVCYDARGNGDGETAPTLTGDHQNRITDYTAICVGNGQLHQTDMGDKTGALNCMHDQQAIIHKSDPPRKYIIRRLTPLECCRLQGFPDWWEDGVDGSDTARYKMWGNGIALPCAVDVLGRIAKALR